MMLLEGLPISPGFARGIAVVYDQEIERRLELPHRSICHLEIDSEFTRLNDALEDSGEDLKRVERTALSESKLVESARLLSAHSAWRRRLPRSSGSAAAVRHALQHIACNDAREVADLAVQCRTPQQVRDLCQHLPSTETTASQWEKGDPCERATRILREAPVVTQWRSPPWIDNNQCEE